jgi:EAL and modified HD-GYP domain-containing signal transduction protein
VYREQRSADSEVVKWMPRPRNAEPTPGEQRHADAARAGAPAWTYVGRQPIVNGRFELLGYELHHRTAATNNDAGDSAAWQLAVEVVAEFGFDRLSGTHLGFVDTSVDFMVSNGHHVLPPERVILQLPDNARSHPDLPDALLRAGVRGYRFGGSHRLGCDDAIGTHLSFVKLGVRDLGIDHFPSVIERLVETAPQARLVACQVNTAGEMEMCRRLGLDAFSGSFIEQPTILSRRTSTAMSTVLLELTAALQDPDLSLKRLASILERDLALPYRLLRLANSGAVSLPLPVESIHEALVLLGTETVRQMASVLALATLAGGADYLVEQYTVRAKLCEVLALSMDPSLASAAFTVGLFSGLEVLLGEPIEVVTSRLPLAVPVVDALTRRAGPLGELLRITIEYERGQLDKVPAELIVTCAAAFEEAIEWAHHLRPELRSSADSAPNPVPA